MRRSSLNNVNEHKNEDDLKNEIKLKYEDDLKNEGVLKNEGDVKKMIVYSKGNMHIAGIHTVLDISRFAVSFF